MDYLKKYLTHDFLLLIAFMGIEITCVFILVTADNCLLIIILIWTIHIRIGIQNKPLKSAFKVQKKNMDDLLKVNAESTGLLIKQDTIIRQQRSIINKLTKLLEDTGE